MVEEFTINREALLERFPGKGGWTYILLPEVNPGHKDPSGQVKINGFIDRFVLQSVSLMSLGKGRYFFPVNANIRKVLQKEAGDTVHLKIVLPVSEEVKKHDFLEILADEPEALTCYQYMDEEEQQAYLSWINEVKTQDAKIERMAEAVNTIYERYRYSAWQKTKNQP